MTAAAAGASGPLSCDLVAQYLETGRLYIEGRTVRVSAIPLPATAKLYTAIRWFEQQLGAEGSDSRGRIRHWLEHPPLPLHLQQLTTRKRAREGDEEETALPAPGARPNAIFTTVSLAARGLVQAAQEAVPGASAIYGTAALLERLQHIGSEAQQPYLFGLQPPHDTYLAQTVETIVRGVSALARGEPSAHPDLAVFNASLLSGAWPPQSADARSDLGYLATWDLVQRLFEMLATRYVEEIPLEYAPAYQAEWLVLTERCETLGKACLQYAHVRKMAIDPTAAHASINTALANLQALFSTLQFTLSRVSMRYEAPQLDSLVYDFVRPLSNRIASCAAIWDLLAQGE